MMNVNQCQCHSQFVNETKTAKLFLSPRQRKTVAIQTVIVIIQEKTFGGEMSLDVDGR